MKDIRHSAFLKLSAMVMLAQAAGCGSGFLGLQDYPRDLITGGLLAAALLNRPTGTGTPCWDTNGNGRNDPEEDVNGDGAFDLADCLAGAGFPLPDGLSCWDLNGNGVADFGGVDDAGNALVNEDVNGDGVIDVFDCRGPAGEDGLGSDMTLSGPTGLNCWDANGNGVGDPAEDINGDGLFDALDCQGPPGAPGPAGASGSSGAPGMALFHVFVDDFFTALGTVDGSLPVVTVDITEPALGLPNDGAGDSFSDAVAYRVAVPEMYDPGNDVTMRIHFFRTGGFQGDACFIFRLDARRLRDGTGINPYGDTRWVRVDLGDATPEGALSAVGLEGTLVTIDLPLNRMPGLGLPNELDRADFLAFELSTFRSDGALYEMLAVEFFESRPGTATLAGATVFTSDDPEDPNGARCDFTDCNNNLVPDSRDIASETSLDCNENDVPDECDIESGSSEDCNASGVPDECELVTPDGAIGIGGAVFLTGHDPDFHAGLGGNSTGARNINNAAINFIMSPSMNPFVRAGVTKFLYVQSRINPPSGHTDGKNGIVASGYAEGADFDHHDASTLGAALDRLGSSYSAIVVASDFGGILTQAELDILNARSGDLIRFINAGGGLYAMAESNSQGQLTPGGGHFGYLPFVVSSTGFNQSEVGVTVTSTGTELGLTNADVNGNASHNIFTETSGLNIVDIDQFGQILSLAGRGLINPDGGLVTDCNANGALDECELADGSATDCNGNGLLDECDIAADSALDCNENGILDVCEEEAAAIAGVLPLDDQVFIADANGLRVTNITDLSAVADLSGTLATSGGFDDGHHMVFDTFGQRIFVSDHNVDFDVFDPSLSSLSVTWGVSLDEPLGLAVMPNGQILITDEEDDAGLFRLNSDLSLDATTPSTAFTSDDGAEGVVFDPVRNRIFVADEDGGEIEIFDGTTLANIATVSFCGSDGPYWMGIDATGGRLFVLADSRCPSFSDGGFGVHVFDIGCLAGDLTFTQTLIGSDGALRNCYGALAVSESTDRLFVIDYCSDVVDIYDTNTLQKVGTVPVERAGELPLMVSVGHLIER